MGMMFRKAILPMLLIMAGCAPTLKMVGVPRPEPAAPRHEAFEHAERSFSKGLYGEALAEYNVFLREAYDDPFAATALFRIGKILRFSGRDRDAIAVLDRLRHEFPNSDLVPGAVLEILRIHYDSGNYAAVISRGIAILDGGDPKLRQPAVMLIVADAYAALGGQLEAARFYYQAWQADAGEISATAWQRMKGSVEHLNAHDIQQLITQVTDNQVMSFLLYRLGMAFIMDENYDDALDVLNAFVMRFPDHPDHQDAANLIQSLIERARFTPFSVGCILPLTGAYAVFGQRAMDGIELALNQFGQAAGGVPFKVVVRDSRSDPDVAVRAVDELDQQKVGAILGPMATSESAAASAQSRGIPMLVFTQREGVTDIGPYIFRNFITPEMQVRSLAAYAVHRMGIKRFAILYPAENYGRRYMNLFWDQVIENGGVVNGVEAYDPDGTDFAQPIKKLGGIFYDVPPDLLTTGIAGLRRSNSTPGDWNETRRGEFDDPVVRLSGIPLGREDLDDLTRRTPDSDDQWHPVVDFDALFIPDAPKKAALVIPQLAYYDIRDVTLLGTNLWNAKSLLEAAGEYMQGAIVVDGFFAESQSEKVRGFVDAFQQTYGRVPGIVEAVAYDSAVMVLQTLRQAASDSRRDVKQALLKTTGFQGVTGATGFASNGETEKTLELLQIRRNRFEEIPPAADATLQQPVAEPRPQS